MKKKISLKELCLDAWRDFTENFVNWLFLCGMQVVVVVGFLFCSGMSLWIFHYLFAQYSKIFTVGIISIFSVFSCFVMLTFPIMYKQNALEAVFGKNMIGFDINNRFFSYIVSMAIYYTLASFALLFGIFPGIFLMQRWRFVGLYLLDHGGSIRHAFTGSWHMTKGYVWFLIAVSCLQFAILVFFGCTIVGLLAGISLVALIDANIYKKLHTEYDKNLLLCSCEA